MPFFYLGWYLFDITFLLNTFLCPLIGYSLCGIYILCSFLVLFSICRYCRSYILLLFRCLKLFRPLFFSLSYCFLYCSSLLSSVIVSFPFNFKHFFYLFFFISPNFFVVVIIFISYIYFCIHDLCHIMTYVCQHFWSNH